MKFTITISRKPFADLDKVIGFPMAFEIIYFSIAAVIAWIPFLSLFSWLILFPLGFLVMAWISFYIVKESMKRFNFNIYDATILGFLEATFSAAMFLLIFFFASFFGTLMLNFLFPTLLNIQGLDILLASFYIGTAWIVLGAGIVAPLIIGRTVFCLIAAFLLQKIMAEERRPLKPEK